jgi:hypothetical protein
MRILAGLGILLLALGYPACELAGLDGCMGWMSNGHLPTAAELLGCALVLGARVAQWLVAPVLGLTWLGWLATARLRA